MGSTPVVSPALRAQGPPRASWGLIYIRAEPHAAEANGWFPPSWPSRAAPGAREVRAVAENGRGVMSGPGGVTVLDEGPLAALRLSGCRCTLRMDRVGTARSGDAAGSHSTLSLARRRDEPNFSHRLSPSSLPPGPSSLGLVELQLPDWPPGGARLPTQAGWARPPSRAPGSIPGAGSRAPGLPPDWGRVQDAL